MYMKQLAVQLLGWLPSVALIGFTSGCGTLGGNPESKKTAAVSSPVTFYLTDAAIDDVKSVFITIASLDVSSSEGEWVNIPLSVDTEVDLLQLQNGKTSPLAALSQLPAGTYQQTRLVLSEAKLPRVIDADGTEHQLKIPSAYQNGIKIITPFTVVENVALALTIDFDVRKSLKKNGNGHSEGKYMLKPVLRLVEDKQAGAIAGRSSGGKVACVYKQGSNLDSSSDCDAAETSAIVNVGKYQASFLPAGKYTVRVFGAGDAVVDTFDVEVSAGQTAEPASKQ